MKILLLHQANFSLWLLTAQFYLLGLGQSTDSMTEQGKVAGIQNYHTQKEYSDLVKRRNHSVTLLSTSSPTTVPPGIHTIFQIVPETGSSWIECNSLWQMYTSALGNRQTSS
jgi:hypothetical protein